VPSAANWRRALQSGSQTASGAQLSAGQWKHDRRAGKLASWRKLNAPSAGRPVKPIVRVTDRLLGPASNSRSATKRAAINQRERDWRCLLLFSSERASSQWPLSASASGHLR